MTVPLTQEEAVAKFSNFINERPGLDFADYGRDNLSGYYADRYRIAKQLTDARNALDQFQAYDYDPELMENAMSAWSGRLSFNDDAELHYTAGQYHPTEYRGAAAACLESYNASARRKKYAALTFSEWLGKRMMDNSQTGLRFNIRGIMEFMHKKGHYYFDESNRNFFNAKYEDKIYELAGHEYLFIDSIKHRDEPREYRVMKLTDSGDIDAVAGGLTRAEALHLAREMQQNAPVE